MRREEQPRQSVLFTEGSLGEEERQWAPARPRPWFLPPARALLPQDQPLRDGLLRVAVKPRQCLVLRVLREDAVCSLGAETATRVTLRPQHRTAAYRDPAVLPGTEN